MTQEQLDRANEITQELEVLKDVVKELESFNDRVKRSDIEIQYFNSEGDWKNIYISPDRADELAKIMIEEEIQINSLRIEELEGEFKNL